MQQNSKLDQNNVHLWSIWIPDLLPELPNFLCLLNQEEQQRAERFRFATHRERFIIARGMLRNILSLYVDLSPSDITFSLGTHGKPYLENNPLQIQFNLSHSNDTILYAMTQGSDIGIDIEKIEEKFNRAVAKRFFSAEENRQLSMLPASDRIKCFFRIWAGKEAIIKMLGVGLYTALNEFSIHLHQDKQIILIDDRQYYLEHCDIYSGYQSAFAVSSPIQDVKRWQWTLEGPREIIF